MGDTVRARENSRAEENQVPEADWLDRLQVEHRAKSDGIFFHLRSLYMDFSPPPVAHRFDVQAPEYLEREHLKAGGEPLDRSFPKDIDEGQKLARVVVNEFPWAMWTDYGDEWGWWADSFDYGPSAALGGVIQTLIEAGEIDYGPGTEGAVLQLQNLEVHPEWRRRGIGSRLVRFALGLLSRSDWDYAVGEVQTIRAIYPPLWPPEGQPRRIDWEEPGVVRCFMSRLGFEEAGDVSSGLPVGDGEIMALESAPVFHQSIIQKNRLAWLAKM